MGESFPEIPNLCVSLMSLIIGALKITRMVVSMLEPGEHLGSDTICFRDERASDLLASLNLVCYTRRVGFVSASGRRQQTITEKSEKHGSTS